MVRFGVFLFNYKIIYFGSTPDVLVYRPKVFDPFSKENVTPLGEVRMLVPDKTT